MTTLSRASYYWLRFLHRGLTFGQTLALIFISYVVFLLWLKWHFWYLAFAALAITFQCWTPAECWERLRARWQERPRLFLRSTEKAQYCP